MFSSKDLFFTPAVSTGYTVSKSLRFRSGSSTYLNRTFSGSPTTFTFSFWIKRGILATQQLIACARYNANGSASFIDFTSSDTLRVLLSNNTSSTSITTTAVFRDPSAWYHIVVSSTAGGTAYIYVNGTEYASGSVPSGYWLFNNGANVVNTISRYGDSASLYFDGYLAETYFIDGSALTPSSFGAYDSNGIWQPAAYTGSYGTNGFYLKYTDVGATSGSNAGYGKDFSGNSNYWTTNNFNSTSTATTYDSMLDSPTNATGDIGNYCVGNPLSVGANTSLSNANLSGTLTGAGGWAGTICGLTSGKWYWEATPTANSGNSMWVGFLSDAYTKNDNGWPYSTQTALYANDARNGNNASYGATWTTNNVIGIALDLSSSSGSITFYKDGVSQGTMFSSLTSSAVWRPFISGGGTGTTIAMNFGQRPFVHTPPSGFSALNTQNLTTPTITNGAQYMAAVTYTGSASTQSVTATSTNSGNNPNAVTFQPDLVWIKDRTNAQSHKLTDAVRGTTKAISTDSTAAEATDANGVTAFNNNGFSLGTGTRAYSDSNLDSYVAWQWKEGVSQGFDIVSYAGDNTSNRNISHNLGVAPAFAWVKSLSTGSFYIYHQNLTGSTYFLKCNSTDGTNAQTNTNTPWGTGNWSSTQFMVTNNATNNLNASSTNYIGYLWAAIAGYSAFGSYTGNGLADGPFVYTGFRPRFILRKRSDAVSNWLIMDTSRNTYNAANAGLYPDLSDVENTGPTLDILSNGFKVRGTGSAENTSNGTYIYYAAAENPFKISRAR